jgi:hypothetical protein
MQDCARMSQFDQEPDPDYRVSNEAAGEAKRLAQHPVEEAARLEKTAEEGRSGATPAIVLLGVGLGVWAFATVLMAAIFLIVWLAVR